MDTTTPPRLVRPIYDSKAREERRRLAVQRVLEGETQKAVAESLKVSAKSVCNWMAWYRVNGEKGLRAIPHPGPASKLSGAQEKEVCSWLSKDATAFGFHNNLWTSPRVVKLIREKFEIKYNPNYFCRWLRNHHFSPQKPRLRAAQRDEARIAAWPGKEWQAILKKGLPKKPTWC
jgi:transposase